MNTAHMEVTLPDGSLTEVDVTYTFDRGDARATYTNVWSIRDAQDRDVRLTDNEFKNVCERIAERELESAP